MSRASSCVLMGRVGSESDTAWVLKGIIDCAKRRVPDTISHVDGEAVKYKLVRPTFDESMNELPSQVQIGRDGSSVEGFHLRHPVLTTSLEDLPDPQRARA